MTTTENHAEPTDWQCSKCHCALEPKQIMVSYLGNSYPVQLMCCPTCGLVFVPEDLALGRMNDVEKALEDK